MILGGLAKKMLIADYLATHIVNGVFSSPQQYSSWETLVGIVAYSVQIYCDFSAYSDIAIGVALLLGFEMPVNFNAPYAARTIQDFWRRWHITLSSWLRDYLYIPLGGNRKGPRTHHRQPDPHVPARRPLARRRLDVRPLGRHARHRPGAGAPRAPTCAAGGASPSPARPPGARALQRLAHVRLRHRGVGVLPRRLDRRRLLGAVAAGGRPRAASAAP